MFKLPFLLLDIVLVMYISWSPISYWWRQPEKAAFYASDIEIIEESIINFSVSNPLAGKYTAFAFSYAHLNSWLTCCHYAYLSCDQHAQILSHILFILRYAETLQQPGIQWPSNIFISNIKSACY